MSSCYCIGPPGNCPCAKRQRYEVEIGIEEDKYIPKSALGVITYQVLVTIYKEHKTGNYYTGTRKNEWDTCVAKKEVFFNEGQNES